MTSSPASALEKRIKRRVHAQAHEARIVPAPGWKASCASELQAILDSFTQPGKFTAEWVDDPEGLGLKQLDFRHLLEIPQRLLTAQACWWKILDRHVGSFGDLADALDSLDISLYLPSQAHVSLKVQSFQSHLYHEGKMHECISQALNKKGWLVVDDAALHILAEQRGNRLSLFLALGPYPLHHRHYKAEARHGAPLQECLAASALRWFMQLPEQLAWQPDHLVIPFTGSGTLLFESWLLLGQIPAFLWRSQDYLEVLPATPRATLESIRQRLLQRMQTPLTPALLIEKDPATSGELLSHLEHFKKPLASYSLNPLVTSVCADFFKSTLPPSAKILAPLNPPYGLRLNQEGKSRPAEFYQHVAVHLRKWPKAGQDLRGFILTPDEDSLQSLRQHLGPASVQAVQSFSQGGQHIRCMAFRVQG